MHCFILFSLLYWMVYVWESMFQEINKSLKYWMNLKNIYRKLYSRWFFKMINLIIQRFLNVNLLIIIDLLELSLFFWISMKIKIKILNLHLTQIQQNRIFIDYWEHSYYKSQFSLKDLLEWEKQVLSKIWQNQQEENFTEWT
jgi:hypothetical protein